MKIKMLVCMAGTNIVLRPGDIHETDAAEAGRLIDAGFAESVSETSETPAKRGKK